MDANRAPRISVNKLGEYMVATATRRRSIVREQKRPSKAITARYGQAEAPLLQFLPRGDSGALMAAAQRLRTAPASTDWQRSDNTSTADALDAIARMSAELLADGLQFKPAPARPAKLTIGGLQVSVQPDALIVRTVRGVPSFGALKFHFIRDDERALTPGAQEYVAALLHQWCATNALRGFTPAPALSRSVDVFRARIVPGKTRQQRALANVAAACEEIVARWPTT